MDEKEIIKQKREEYKRGFVDGLACFAYWEDGKQYVGTSSKRTLKQAIEEVEHSWNFEPPTSVD